ncbi:hypothetical protein C2G38_2156839 [Gigaspora rosea]|uniref:Ion transport domain-containing protein n=1 Tax=Gigaspora rosea TaxID=44941 RepID=A0A397W5L3_9GLOM|nr:hypothetical protein C2G38_2156839 [Gigaspora rosea]
MASGKYIICKELQGLLFQWKLDCKPESIVLEAKYVKDGNDTWKLDILPSFHTNGEKFILQCDRLENDDLIMTTQIGIFVWSVKHKLKKKGKEIRMLYYWNNCNLKGWNSDLEKFNLEKVEKNKLFNNKDSERFLPASNYEIICKNLDVVFGREKLFYKFLGDNIDDEFYLTCYGNDLMKTLIKLNDDFWIHDLGRCCLNAILKNLNFMISKISLLKIIFENFTELSKDHPAYIASLLTQIATSFLDIYASNIAWSNFVKYFVNLFKNSRHSSVKLVIPLPNFVTYPKDYNFWKELLLPESSGFAESPYNKMINYELYKYINIEALLEFKWNTYGRMYYFVIWAIYTIFLCSFTIAATLSRKIYQDDLNFLLYLTIFLDLGVFLFPTISSFIWLHNGTISVPMIAISILLLDIKFLLFFRVFEFSGTYFSMIFRSAKSTFSFSIIFLFIIFAFAHSLYFLLHSEIYDNVTDENTLFTTISGALLPIYIMLTGDVSQVSDWNLSDNPILIMFIIAFFFLSTIYLMNLFIGLIINAINDIGAKESFLILKAEILSEIELFYMLPHQRRKENWFPYIIFYEAHTIELRNLAKDILDNKWTAYKKPYFSLYFRDTLQLPKDLHEPNVKDIESRFKDLVNLINAKFEELK